MTGRQSAVWMARSRPGVAEMRPSPEGFAGNRIDIANDVGMDLAKRNQRPERPASVARTAAPMGGGDRAEVTEKRNPVAFDCGSGIVLRETEIEIAFPVGAGKSSNPRREAVNEPREPQVTRAKD